MKEIIIPGYLKKGWEGSRWKRVMRFRLRNKLKGNKYWERKDRKICRLCVKGHIRHGSIYGKNVGNEPPKEKVEMKQWVEC